MVNRVVVVDRDLGLKKILIDLKELAKAELFVGIQAGTKTTVDYVRGRKQEAGINVAAYAAANEFGTDRIDARPFMRTSFDENLNLLEPFISHQYGQIIDGDLDIKTGLGRIGQLLQDNVKVKIRQILIPELSPITIAKKKSKKPLIDFGQMIASVRYVIRMK